MTKYGVVGIACVLGGILFLHAPPDVAACAGTALAGMDTTDPDADLIVTATAVRVVDPRSPFDQILSTFDMMEWTFVVDGVEKGSAPDRLSVRTPRFDGSCGFPFKLGSRYRLVARDYGDGLEVWLHNGTRMIDPLADAPQVEGSFGGATGMPFSAIALIGLTTGIGLLYVWRLRAKE